VRYGVAFAQAFNARLDLLHVVPRQDLEVLLEGERVVHVLTDSADAQASVEPDALMHEAERQMLATLLTEQEQKELRTEYVLRVSGPGGVYVEIVRYAEEQAIDLIVIGSHGRGYVAHMLMGGVAEKVVRKAPCPLLMVRHPEHEFVLPDETAGGPRRV
jgi:nucleotide-binding universal stress UspA family protein